MLPKIRLSGVKRPRGRVLGGFAINSLELNTPPECGPLSDCRLRVYLSEDYQRGQFHLVSHRASDGSLIDTNAVMVVTTHGPGLGWIAALLLQPGFCLRFLHRVESLERQAWNQRALDCADAPYPFLIGHHRHTLEAADKAQ